MHATAACVLRLLCGCSAVPGPEGRPPITLLLLSRPVRHVTDAGSAEGWAAWQAIIRAPCTTVLELGPLERTQTTLLLAQLAGVPPAGVDPVIGRAVHVVAAGNPQYAAEALRQLEADGVVTIDKDKAHPVSALDHRFVLHSAVAERPLDRRLAAGSCWGLAGQTSCWRPSGPPCQCTGCWPAYCRACHPPS